MSVIHSSLVTYNSCPRVAARSITSLIRVFTGSKRAADQAPLIFGKFDRQIVNRKPARALDFKAARLWTSERFGAKVEFDLPGPRKSSRKQQLDVPEFNSN